jgi:PAS domain S-box-containing protein
MEDKSPHITDMLDRHTSRFFQSVCDYAFFTVSLDGNILAWNLGATKLAGWSEQEIVGKLYSTVFPDTATLHTGLQAIAAEPDCAKTLHIAEWLLRKDGTQLRTSSTADPLRDGDGSLLGFAFVCRDIADAEMADESLRKSEEQFQLLMQGVVDYAIYMLDQHGNVSSWNAGAERIKGYTRAEILGNHFSRFYTEEDRAAGVPKRALETALREGRFESESLRVRKDGTRFFAHVVIDPIFDSQGRHVGFGKVTRDITEKQAAKVELERTQRALQQSQKLETIGKLTGGVAHDFNNLLQVIAGNLQLLAPEVQENTRARQRVDNALAGVKRGAKLANHLLAFGRRQPLVPSVINFSRFLRGFDDMLQRSLGEAIEIETIVSGGLWNTFIDSAQLENALLNLAINARDAMNGTGKLTIEIGNAYLDEAYARSHPEVLAGQYVMLAVTDTGSGMTPEVMAQAVEPFFSTKPEGHGTGLGLSMVYGFVKQSGGHLTIYSEVGHGTTVKLYLPRSFEREDIAEEFPQQTVLGGTETVLVAEDDEQVCSTVVDMLKGLGYRVLQARDGDSAFAIIQSGIKIDLLFTDVVMPGALRSPDLARKAQESFPDLAVLFTSGYTQNAIVHGGRLDKGVELITKPYTREDLARKIRRVLANQKHRRQHAVSRLGRPNQDANSAQRPLRVLLVDDDEQICAITAEMIEDLGHTVLTARSGEVAMISLETESPDVMLIDIGLPGMSGVELAGAVRRSHPEARIFYASGQELPAGLDYDGLLLKPYDSAGIASVCARVLNLP